MNRFSNLEKEYVLDVLNNEFNTSKNSLYNNKLELLFSEVFNAKYAIGHTNGTVTMHTALSSLGISKEDEVIVPPLTMSSTGIAVLLNGSIPIFADVDKDTFNISPESIKKVITKRTKAIITVSLYGLPPEYDSIMSICKENNLALIEDNAECLFGKYNGKLVGQFGDFSSFSFQASKHITSGEGGMLLCNNETLADNARRFSCLGYAGVSAKQGKITRNDIQDPQYSRHITLGTNYRMSELQAAVALGQLQRSQELVEQRIRVAKIFDEVITNSSLLIKQFEPENCQNTYWSYSTVLNTPNPEVDWYSFRKLFQQNGGDGYYAAWKLSYFEPLFLNYVQSQYDTWQNYETGLCPVAEYLQPRMLQFKTNYWNINEAEKQAEILFKTLKQF